MSLRNLPAKSVEETLRHKMEYEEMVAGAKRRGEAPPTAGDLVADVSPSLCVSSEVKEAQRKKRQMKERHRREESISNAMVVWNAEILPHWDVMYVPVATPLSRVSTCVYLCACV